MSTEGLFRLDGKVVIVTGAYGQLGQAYCDALVAAGASVAALDRPDVIAGACALPGVLPLPADVLDLGALEDALETVQQELGPPWGLVNNAALDSPPDAAAEDNGPFETFPESSFDQVMAVNVKGVMLCCQVFGGAMAKQDRGAIINVGSIYGVVSPDQSIYDYRRKGGETFFKPVAYSASKSAIYNLTRYLATYWASAGVRVNTLTLAGVFNGQDDAFLDGYLKRVPMGRMADPEDYTGPVVFLLSEASRYMTGAEMRVDGGWTAW